MKKIIKILIVVLCFISITKCLITQVGYKNVHVENKGVITGKIINIKRDDEKVIFDVRNKNKIYRATVYDAFKHELGDYVSLSGTYYTASDNTVFNLFNYRKYLLSQNITFLFKPDKIEAVSKNKNVFYLVKNKMIKRAEKYRSKEYLKTFLLGDSSDVDGDVKENYQIIGISHLMAVSGMHVTTILLVINVIMKKWKYKTFFTIIALLFFLFLTNFTISLTRTLLFLFLIGINKKIRLFSKSTSILIITALLLLLFNSYLIYNVGFVFSVVISFFIILISDRLKVLKGYFKKTMIVSLTAFLASLPIIACNFFKINFLSPLFNLILVPFVSLIIFPFSMLVFLFPFMDYIFMIFINTLESLARIFSNIQFLTFVISKPNFVFVLIYYLSLYLSIKINFKYIMIFLMVMLININSRFFITHPQLTFLDVGQGDCCVFVIPTGKCILIDTGGNVFNNGTISKNKIIPYLNSLGINKVECLILTHGDADHMGEAKTLVKNISVKKIIINKGTVNNLEKQMVQEFNAKKENYRFVFGNYELLFLNEKIYFNNENKNSIVIYLEIFSKKIMLMGDADREVEKDIIKMYNLPKLDILKVGHHGSNTSSCNEFIKVISPKYSVISVGLKNKYGHPHEDTLDTLRFSNVFRTDKDGSIKFVFRRNMVNKYVCKPYIIVER